MTGGIEVTRKFIADVLQASTGLSGAAAEKLASKVVDQLIAELKTKGRINFPKFGTFVVREKSLKRAVNPKTRQPVEWVPGKRVTFKASRHLRPRL